MRARSLWALSLSISAALAGCGLSLDYDPPDPQAELDAGLVGIDAGGGGADAGSIDDASSAECVHDGDCANGSFCDGQERCAEGVCEPGEPPCPDASACLLRTCDEAESACGDFVSTCDDAEICTPEGACIPRPSCGTSEDCPDDGDPCTGTTECVAGECAFRPAPRCGFATGCLRNECVAFIGCRDVVHHELCDENDGMACTVPTCSAETGACTEVSTNALCADAFECTNDACSPTAAGRDSSGCTHVAAHTRCDDGATCTTDFCAPAAGRRDARGCVSVPNDAACAGMDISLCSEPVCVGARAAATSGGSGCARRYDSSRCMAGEICVPGVGSIPATCVALTGETCTADVACDDGDPCNGLETCVGARCVPGAGCPDAGCEQGWCDLSGGAPTCALRATASCPGFP